MTAIAKRADAATSATRPESDAPAGPRSPAPDRLPLGRKLAYGVGELVVGIRTSSLNLVLFPFYTDVALLAPALVGLAIGLGKIWDGVNDPIIGYLSDHTRTRHGRRRPFLLFSAIPVAIAFAAIWRPPGDVSSLFLFLYLFGALFFFDIFFGFYATPYLTLGAEMSPDYDERTRVAAIRAMFHNLGLLLGGAGMLALVEGFGRGARGHGRTGVVLAVVMAVSGLVAFFGTREPGIPPREHAPSVGRFVTELRETLQLRSFRILLLSFVFLLTGSSLNQSFAVYVFRDAMGAAAQSAYLILVYLGSATLSFPLWAAAAARIGKIRAFEVCLIWSIVALSASPMMSPELPFWTVLGFVALAGLGVGGYVLPVAIVADIFDEDEIQSGRRREGAFFGVWTLVMKLASAIGIGIAGLVLPLTGYVAGAAAQTPETLSALKLTWGPGAALFFVATLLIFRRFPLTRERHLEIQRRLAARHLRRG